MRFDAADLALIETSLDVVEEPARGIIEELLAMVRELQEDRMNAEALEDELEGERSKREDAEETAEDLQREVYRLENRIENLEADLEQEREAASRP